jgi:hypothetical protein
MVNRIEPLDSSGSNAVIPAAYAVAASRKVTPVAPKEVPKETVPSTGERLMGVTKQSGQQVDNREAPKENKPPTPKMCVSCQTGGGPQKSSGSDGISPQHPSIRLVNHVCPECGKVHASSSPSQADNNPPSQVDIHV